MSLKNYFVYWYVLKQKLQMYLAYCDETLYVTGRIWEIKYVNAVFQTNIASIYNQLCLTHKIVQVIFKLKSCHTKVMV